MSLTIGVDFDNTIVSYDALIHQIALDRHLIGQYVNASKKSVRDAIRALPDGEISWQKVQGAVYGPLMKRATPMNGAEAFFRRCKDAGIACFIVSHKTESANYDETLTNLRSSALEWMRNHGIFDQRRCGLTECKVFFESTREDKIQRVAQLGCTHFIDDLEETFREESFPPNVTKILYDPHGETSKISGLTTMRSWYDIAKYFFP